MPLSILLISNIPSIHQLPLSEALYQRLGDGFKFACLEPVHEERIRLGWTDPSIGKPYVIRSFESDEQKKQLQNMLAEADVVVHGAVLQGLIGERIRAGKLTFKFCERHFKEGLNRIRQFTGIGLNHYWNWRRMDKPNHHLLTLGAYCGHDYQCLGIFKRRVWRFGYITATNSREMVPRDDRGVRIFNAGRMLTWKQIPLIVEAARLLRDVHGLTFLIEIVGAGEEERKVRELAAQYQLNDVVKFSPPVSPEAVRKKMRQAHIYVLPSNYGEGWGAVVNEAMSEGCCVVASLGAGATPSLIEHGKTGFWFKSGDVDQFTETLKGLVQSPDRCAQIGDNAMKSIHEDWSPEVAADRLIALSKGLLGDADMPNYTNGLCSVDPCLSPKSYIRMLDEYEA